MMGGRGRYWDARGLERPIVPGDWILVFPEVAHRYWPDADSFWNEIYVCFDGPVFEAWRDTHCFDAVQPVGHWLPPRKGVARFAEFFDYAGRPGCSPLQALCAWQLLLSEILGTQASPSPARAPWLAKALELLERPAAESRLEEIAAAAGLGYESFRKKFESEMGMPPLRYALGRRVEHARALMRMQQLTNKELATQLGFYDEFHFSKTFARFSGMSPREFRTELYRKRQVPGG